MILIKEIVKQTLKDGYLSVKAQDQIRILLQTNYDSEDIDALIILQRSIAAGKVQKESPSQRQNHSSTGVESSSNIRLAYQVAAELACAAAMALSLSTKNQNQSSLGT
ncbi:MAG: hypothetical protein EAZ76_05385 [Nostocales cyanobacterium]|nr:MAG: hypothetical protein EAZ87_13170 [Nostocales cyanobacterium]TAF18146.1 MAG: hypothetical protein EAZ76_05385 [Nostocales cyanobacterium]